MTATNNPAGWRYPPWTFARFPREIDDRQVCDMLCISMEELDHRIAEGSFPKPNDNGLRWVWNSAHIRLMAGRQSMAGYVYFLQSGPYIKIGFSVSVKQRHKLIAQSTPNEVVFLKAIRGTRATERELHRKFQDLRHSGEWFRCDPKLENFIRKARVDLPRRAGQ